MKNTDVQRAPEVLLGLPLAPAKMLWSGMLDVTVALKVSDVKRWGTIRRYGDRNCFLIAELADGRVFEIRLSQNEPNRKWLQAKREDGVCRINPGWGGRFDSGHRVFWHDNC